MIDVIQSDAVVLRLHFEISALVVLKMWGRHVPIEKSPNRHYASAIFPLIEERFPLLEGFGYSQILLNTRWGLWHAIMRLLLLYRSGKLKFLIWFIVPKWFKWRMCNENLSLISSNIAIFLAFLRLRIHALLIILWKDYRLWFFQSALIKILIRGGGQRRRGGWWVSLLWLKLELQP